ncbi:hypothetical protein ALON55S_08410 [Alishewanella longhuensis]
MVEKGRVGPGEMLAIDTTTGKIWRSYEIHVHSMQRHTYRSWLNDNVQRLVPYEQYATDLIGKRAFTDDEMLVMHKLFNYSYEEIDQVVTVLAKDAQEAVGSMGDDTPMACYHANHVRCLIISASNLLRLLTRLSIRYAKHT